MNSRFPLLSPIFFGLFVICCGCSTGGGDVGTVDGVVTVDGVPIRLAAVSFYPSAGRASVGSTDDKGYYKLVLKRNVEGAFIGSHKVVIRTMLEKGDAGGELANGRKEIMPPKYSVKDQTELTATVESGHNKIDFELKSADF